MISIAIYVLERREDLSLWHQVDLEEEFRAGAGVEDFAEYLELEERLFAELEDKVYSKSASGGENLLNRYARGSLVDPTTKTRNWNRTFEMTEENPVAGVLLLHGLSDSPYSLKTLGRTFHKSGAYVVGLRIPGHGTAPSGLVEVSWVDWAAAVRLAMRHLKQQVGDQPIHVVGYSNGGALAVNYALDCLEDESLPKAESLVLLSPEIGISKAAELAVWQGRVGHWLGLDKLAWNSISPEYNPYKYISFAVNAGDQAHRITTRIAKQVARCSKKGKMEQFPRVLAFQSCVDATVSPEALVSRLFDHLSVGEHELVLFDVNRNELIEHLLVKDPAAEIEGLLHGKAHPFSLGVVTNETSESGVSPEVNIKLRLANESTVSLEAMGLSWPDDIYSLSHVALPFPESDPLYGSGDKGLTATLGNRALRGERGTLYVSAGEMLRQKWNPFYSWMEGRALNFMKLSDSE